jgi:hypothetical protein
MWEAKNGDLFLMAGFKAGTCYNDVFKFVLNVGWFWVSGTNGTGSAEGFATSKGVPSTSFYPPCYDRPSLTQLRSDPDVVFLFGGYGGTYGVGTALSTGAMWKFNSSSLEWTWVSGNLTLDHDGNYGPKNVWSTEYYPASREGAMTWLDSEENIWLYGGAQFKRGSFMQREGPASVDFD